jgi:hypothetical protein
MRLKIFSHTPESLEKTKVSILNLYQVVAQKGYIPTEYERDPRRGHTWLMSKPDKYDVFPLTNDYKVFVREKHELSEIWEFYWRYDSDKQFSNALVRLLGILFCWNTEIINHE